MTDDRRLKLLKNLNRLHIPSLNEPFRLDLFHVNCVGADDLAYEHHSLPHVHVYHEMLIPLNGSVSYRIANDTVTVERGQFLVIAPGVEHTRRSFDPSTIKLGLGFSFPEVERDSFATRLRAAFLERACFKCAQTGRMSTYLNRILEEGEEPSFFSVYCIRDLAVKMILEAWSCYDEKNAEEYIEYGKALDPRILEIKRFINDHLEVPINSGAVAEHIHLSIKQLNRVFFLSEGITVSRYISMAKAGKACKLLRSTGMTVQEIAYSLGFDNVKAFSVFFKRNTGLTPSEFRKGGE